MRRRGVTLVALLLAMFCMAPTAGDIGGCGSEARDLDPTAFADARKKLDCERCTECGIGSTRCKNACDPSRAPETAIPKTCEPLFHDGEVCVRKLSAASCDAYATYVADVAPSIPSECEFCKLAPPPVPTTPFASDAGDAAP